MMDETNIPQGTASAEAPHESRVPPASPLAAAGGREPAGDTPPPFARQAIVLVHGMGEQRPMDTIKRFVETVWQGDPQATQNGLPNSAAVWSKPDERAGSLELRRITTRQSAPSPGVFKEGVRSDFYELYWADLTAGSPWKDFIAWLWLLLCRNPVTHLPRKLLSAWIALWAVTIPLGLAAMWTVIPAGTQILGIAIPDAGMWRWLLIGPAMIALHWIVQRTFGRVVRYTQATPGNIAARKAVRERGLALLETLHNDPQYSRIILVGHSLGAILAYELLAFFWSRQAGARHVPKAAPEFDALRALEQAATNLEEAPDDERCLAAWDAAQRDLRQQLAARPLPAPGDGNAINRRWILSDLVTIGSPLTHAEFLLAADRNDLDRRQREREMPTAPPVREVLDPENRQAALDSGFPTPAGPNAMRLFCYPQRGPAPGWDLHHAAVFAVVRWTNIFDPARLILCGDLISGPVRAVFGPAVRDIDLAAVRGRMAGRFTHTRYWHRDAGDRPLMALRQAVNLLDHRQDRRFPLAPPSP